jgi:hypothetical protein
VIGGGTAGLLSTIRIPPGSRALISSVGVAGMAAAGTGLAYADAFAQSVTAPFFVSLLGTSCHHPVLGRAG